MNTTTPQPMSPPRRKTWGDVLDETASTGTPTLYGPPIALLLGPWLFLVLLAIGPFAVVFTLLAAVAVAAFLLAAVVAVIASPYLLVRHLHGQRTTHLKPHAYRHLFRKHRVVSGWLGSLLPKGVS